MPYELSTDGDVRVVSFVGEVTPEDFAALADALTEPKKVAFDLCGATISRDEVQDAAVALAKTLSARRCRTAYVANVPRLRGWASLVAYQGGDDQTRTVSNMAAAMRWLASSEDAIEARRQSVLASERLLSRKR